MKSIFTEPKSIFIVKTVLERKKSDDSDLMMLHRVLYNAACKKKDVKRNIREFSGVVYSESLDRAKLLARIERTTKSFAKMREVAKLLGVDSRTTKEDLKDGLAAFLEAPADHGAVHKSTVKKAEKRAEKEEKKVTKVAKKLGKKAAKKKTTKEDKPKKPLSAYMIFSNEKREELVKKFPELSMPEIAKKTGELWKKADQEKYKEMAKKMKADFEAEEKAVKAEKKQKKVEKKVAKKEAKKAKKAAKKMDVEGEEEEEEEEIEEKPVDEEEKEEVEEEKEEEEEN